MAAIPYNSGTHVKYFARPGGKEVYDHYYGYLIRISAQHVPSFKPVIIAKMVDWLRTNDSEECALWWEKYWTPVHDPRRSAITLADCGYVSCTHQNSQEGKWKPIKRGAGCGKRSDERQSLASFMGNLVEYIHNDSEEHESDLIEWGRPNTFIRNPVPNKAEWDFVQDTHPFLLHFSFPMGIDKHGAEQWADIVSDIMTQGTMGKTPLHQQIEMQHEMMVARHLESGKKIEEYKNPWTKSIFDEI